MVNPITGGDLVLANFVLVTGYRYHDDHVIAPIVVRVKRPWIYDSDYE